MELPFFFKGMLLGFSMSAPVGPLGVLCIRRTLVNGFTNGLITGLGTAAGDAIYGCLAAFGVTFVSAFLLGHQFYLRLIGGTFMLYIGYLTFRAVPPETLAETSSPKNPIKTFVSAFFLTLANPMTVLFFAIVFSGLGLGDPGGSFITSALLVLGVFAGSALWWLTLSTMVNALRNKFDQKRLKWTNRISGLVIGLFGLGSIISVFI